MEFRCIQDCSQCCIEREYYPEKRFGKIGVLILPEEKEKIKQFAKMNKLDLLILPRIGISNKKDPTLIEILAFQMMGKEKNGNLCPFLNTDTDKRSPHGGFPCRIYDDRPLACKTYPLIKSDPMTLDQKCKFCKEHKTADENLDSEIESLLKIKNKMNTDAPFVWRYATGIGEEEDKFQIKTGWILEECDKIMG
ncbi:MAG: YkgJ family cysteine cluster protein [Nitrosopumilus sp.]|nr:YkgJ family cysteine cluster protein [Nitrosopumilus sp.]